MLSSSKTAVCTALPFLCISLPFVLRLFLLLICISTSSFRTFSLMRHVHTLVSHSPRSARLFASFRCILSCIALHFTIPLESWLLKSCFGCCTHFTPSLVLHSFACLLAAALLFHFHSFCPFQFTFPFPFPSFPFHHAHTVALSLLTTHRCPFLPLFPFHFPIICFQFYSPRRNHPIILFFSVLVRILFAHSIVSQLRKLELSS